MCTSVASVLQLVDCGSSSAGATLNTAGCFSPTSFCSYSFDLSLSLLSYLFSLVHSFLFCPLPVSPAVMLSLASIFWLSCIGRNDSEVPSGLYSSSENTHTHTHIFSSLSFLLFLIPALGVDSLSLYLFYYLCL